MPSEVPCTPRLAEGWRPTFPAISRLCSPLDHTAPLAAALFPSALLICLQLPSKSPSHTGYSDRACCTSRKSPEKEHLIPAPRTGSRVGSTEALAAARDVWAGQRRGLRLQGGWNGGGRCHSSCNSFFWKAWSLLATVCWMISSPSASRSFMRSRMAFRTLFCWDKADTAVYQPARARFSLLFLGTPPPPPPPAAVWNSHLQPREQD